MNDKAEAVYAIVSVPCSITKPSYSSYWCAMIFTIRFQSSGFTLLESIGSLKGCTSTAVSICLNSGSARRRFLKSSGSKAPVRIFRPMPIVPPVYINNTLFVLINTFLPILLLSRSDSQETERLLLFLFQLQRRNLYFLSYLDFLYTVQSLYVALHTFSEVILRQAL